MSLLNQKTIKDTITFKGVGLHSGKLVNVSIKSSEPDTGIVFQRVDLKANNLVYPNFANVSNTSLNTTISNDQGIKVSTIEHLMGALFGLGIDNALVEIDNEEVPILDGSAKQFIEKILKAGIKVSNRPIKIIKINKKIEFREDKRFISIEPSKLSLDIDFELKYKNSFIGNQKNKINVYEDDLNEEALITMIKQENVKKDNDAEEEGPCSNSQQSGVKMSEKVTDENADEEDVNKEIEDSLDDCSDTEKVEAESDDYQPYSEADTSSEAEKEDI